MKRRSSELLNRWDELDHRSLLSCCFSTPLNKRYEQVNFHDSSFQTELADVKWDGPGSIHITFAFIFGSTTHLMDETFYSVVAALSHLLHLQIA